MIKIKTDELETLLLCSVRYALTRQSYIVSSVADIVSIYMSQLSEQRRYNILEDINRALGSGYLSDIDKQVWEVLKNELEKMNDT